MSKEKLLEFGKNALNSFLNSYSIIFFSKSRFMALMLIAVTFLDFYAGLAGVIAVATAFTCSWWMGFKRYYIVSGFYTFNSLMVGLGLGIYFEPNPAFYFVLVFASLLTLFLTVLFEGVIGKYQLPYLSVPFLLGIWIVTLASRQFGNLELSERGIYMINELYTVGGSPLVNVYHWFNDLDLPVPMIIYFRSLSAIFFQYSFFAGLLVAIGLIYWSRIAFLLSVIGFSTAYMFYDLLGSNLADLEYSYIGFNYILTSIAISGFFLLPRLNSLLWIFLLTPLISLLIPAGTIIFGNLHLSIYSLPFNIIVLIFIYALKFRERSYTRPELVGYQYYSPETNLYTQVNNDKRFAGRYYAPVSLPFWGEWTITQGYQDIHTHKDDWGYALDFEIQDENGLSYTHSGLAREDYYCFGKPVTAPMDGWIEEIQNGIEDNEIGEVNLSKNWGNAVVIKHHDGLYSKLCHLRNDSIKVTRGQFVRKGEVVAACGNSGRSPYPHLHFQMQITPHIGSKTLYYPVNSYIQNDNGRYELHQFDIPQRGQKVSNIVKNETLAKALHFIPGQKLHLTVTDKIRNTRHPLTWEIHTDIYNNSYIYCKESKSSLYFWNDGLIHYFTAFYGDKKSALFQFYLAGYKILQGAYRDISIMDRFPINIFTNRILLFFQDFLAPFHIFLKSEYQSKCTKIIDDFSGGSVSFNTSATVKAGKKILKKYSFNMVFENNLMKAVESVEGTGYKLIEFHEDPLN